MPQFFLDKCSLSSFEKMEVKTLQELFESVPTKITIRGCNVTIMPETNQIIITSKEAI